MNRSLTLLLVASLLLTACSAWRESRVNPRNWFGGSRSVPAESTASETNPLIPARSGGLLRRPEKEDRSTPIASITEMRVEPVPSGAIIYASGTAARQGAHDSELRPDDPELVPVDGVLGFTFRVVYPEDPTPVGPERSRIVTEAYILSAQALEGVRVIRVSGAQNARESRRR